MLQPYNKTPGCLSVRDFEPIIVNLVVHSKSPGNIDLEGSNRNFGRNTLSYYDDHLCHKSNHKQPGKKCGTDGRNTL